MNFRKGHKHVFKNVNTTEGKKKKEFSLKCFGFFSLHLGDTVATTTT